jgi:hypothetical protein
VQIQEILHWGASGSTPAKTDLRIVGIFTAALCLVGLTDLMFRTSGATALIVIVLLAVGGLLVLWRIWNRSRNVSARTPRHRSTRLPKTKLGSLMASQPTLSNSLVVMLAYVVVLSLAGVMVTGLTLAGVVLVSFAVLAAAGAFAAFRFRQN